jgi:hypothetical protein
LSLLLISLLNYLKIIHILNALFTLKYLFISIISDVHLLIQILKPFKTVVIEMNEKINAHNLCFNKYIFKDHKNILKMCSQLISRNLLLKNNLNLNNVIIVRHKSMIKWRGYLDIPEYKKRDIRYKTNSAHRPKLMTWEDYQVFNTYYNNS